MIIVGGHEHQSILPQVGGARKIKGSSSKSNNGFPISLRRPRIKSLPFEHVSGNWLSTDHRNEGINNTNLPTMTRADRGQNGKNLLRKNVPPHNGERAWCIRRFWFFHESFDHFEPLLRGSYIRNTVRGNLLPRNILQTKQRSFFKMIFEL